MDSKIEPSIGEIKGGSIRTEADFHKAISMALGFPSWYGKNLNALWDILSADLPKPSKLVWHDSSLSKEALGPVFQDIIDILERAQKQYENWGEPDRFRYELR